MSKINILDKSTINQIAAGEVIDRPASIIKELVENSIDAGATSVSIEIKGGGIDLIRITDNGSGIDRDDIKVAFIRHTTSKIKTAEDLSNITSLGFRGEALASIAAVADVELITKTKDAFSAVRYLISGGEEKSFEDIGAPNGTTFIIRDVFKYVPVRRKFLKSSATEGSYCNEVVERIALSHPEVSIKYVNNGRNIVFTNGSSRMKDIIFGIYGRDIASEIVMIDYTGNRNIRVSGCICRPVVVRSNRNTENYFVNGRFIRSQIVFKAIEDAYQPFLMQHKYPFTALYIDIDPSSMDVNVHPSKQEVRFENPEAVYNAVNTAITEALSGKALIHKAEKDNEQAAKDAEQKKKYVPEPFENNLKSKDTGYARTPFSASDRYNVGPGGERVNADPGGAAQSSDFGVSSGNISRNASLNGTGFDAEKKTEIPDDRKNLIPSYKDKYGSGQDKGSVNYSQYDRNLVNPVSGKDTLTGGSESGAHDKGTVSSENISVVSETASNERENASSQEDALPAAFVNEEPAEYTYKQASFFEEDRHIETRSEFNNVFSSGYRIVGQIFGTYWIIESAGCVYIIDQHAAHEKILYEKFMKTIGSDKSTQLLSPPMIISLSAREEAVAEQYAKELAEYGFVAEHFGGHEYALSEVPLNLYGVDARDMFLEIIEELSKDIKGNVIKSIKEKIATSACKAAVKGNTELTEAEAKELLKELLRAENPFNCPHGRPIIIDVTKREIEKKFKRIL
jgi:DNA mismatch repair protein MutL